MTDDATLGDFADEDRSEPTDETAGPSRTRDHKPTPETGATDAAHATYAWGAYICSRCDSSVQRVWRDGDALVCPACKSW